MSRLGLSTFGILSSLISLLLVSVSPPAAAVIRQLHTEYECASVHGGGRATVKVTVDLPRSIKVGKRLPARAIKFDIQVPDAMVTQMRMLSVDALSASSNDAYYRLRERRKPIANLVVPETAVPPSGAMVLRGAGTASGHTFVATGRYPVKVPVAFTTMATAHGTPIGNVDVEISCRLVAGAPDQIAVIRVIRR